jgi:hypothetical protein
MSPVVNHLASLVSIWSPSGLPLGRGHHRGRLGVDVGGEGIAEHLGVQEEVSALAPVRAGGRHRPDRRPYEAAFEPPEELLLALALVAHPAVEVDQRLYLIVAGRGSRDDVATIGVASIGVADEDDRTSQAAQELGEVGRVASEIAKRVGEPDRPESSALQGADLGIEAGRVGPGAVDEDDCRGVLTAFSLLEVGALLALPVVAVPAVLAGTAISPGLVHTALLGSPPRWPLQPASVLSK